MSVIELGEVGAAGQEPESHSAGPWFNPRLWRRWAAAGVVLLCVLVLGASGRPVPPLVHRVWDAELGISYQTTVREDGIFVYQLKVDGAELISYEPATGAVRWKRGLDGAPSYLAQGIEAGLLLISGDEEYAEIELEDGGQGTIVYAGATTAIDARTGEQLWKQPGEVQVTAPDTVLLGERTRTGDLSSIRVVRARDGSDVWKRTVAGAEQASVQQDGPRPSRIVTADAHGNVTVLRYDDGAIVTRRRLPWSPPRPSAGTFSYLTIANDLAIVVSQDNLESGITAYRIDNLQEVWQTRGTSYAFPQDCGPVLCLAENTAVYGIDPLTGRRLWNLPGRGSVVQVADNRLLASTAGPEPAHQVLLEPATGKPVGAGAPGSPLSSALGQEAIILVNRFYTAGASTSSVTRMDVQTGRLTRIGMAEDVDTGQCGTSGHYLACDWSGRLVVTTFG
ncbi:PQQ-binding-like beta-propeller repeat protein [Actinoplanes sp. GCM10030250]|uniref:outer membrane protein assembly factor BamB family protein n=1 Tax=Actinoplanes sp. GCM10030250 TaxID=3273376 RepID=UPI00360D2D7C